MATYQIETSSFPKQLKVYPIVPCQSTIFRCCREGDITAVEHCLGKFGASPFATNMHGENLLHVSARYAHAELCALLLDLDVDGSAYDDRLLTPLDQLLRQVCMCTSPSRVVDTIRVLVERGRCEPSPSVTSNTVACYRGPEEGFAWLFTLQYSGIDIEQRDSDGWTPLGDAAFNFGRWTQLGVEDVAPSWQSLYLLKAGADPHARSCNDLLTPLDTYLRGCTVHQVDHATKWLQVLVQAGIDLHEYGRAEQSFHGPQHLLKSIWDEELWKWIPFKRLVVYEYGRTTHQLQIWLEDFDALSWFGVGRYDLEIFDVLPPVQCALRWKEINARKDDFELAPEKEVAQAIMMTSPTVIFGCFRARRLPFLVLSLILHYIFYMFLSGTWALTVHMNT